MIDIDHFKRFNDEFGHDAGDMVMQHVAGMMMAAVGNAGEAFRFGGEEFTIRLAIWDTGDQALDSTALIDNFRWLATGGTVTVGTKPIPVPK